MGVPTLFKWLSRKYPKSISDCVEEFGTVINGEYVPPNIQSPNPNGIEFDNFYIDMNGIIHNCSHNEGLDKIPKTDADMFNNIFLYVLVVHIESRYLDRLFEIVRPRKLLYLAVDGVAPRAKMNQQRSRRFSAFQVFPPPYCNKQERQDRKDAEDEIRSKMLAAGKRVPPEHMSSFDSNKITPGTEFMMEVCKNLRWYIADRMTHNPAWKNINVILSDGSVPGEGEHKIMDYIRRERGQPGYDPNLKHTINSRFTFRHVIHGLDADLIMLALATHEPYFYILREEVTSSNLNVSRCALCGSTGHLYVCDGHFMIERLNAREKLPHPQEH